MKQYLDNLKNILDNGTIKTDRTGTGTKSVFGLQMRFNLEEGFPLLTTKKLHYKSIFEELFWFIDGDTSNRNLNNNGVRIWNEWANENGDLGKIYSAQWRYVLSESNKPILIDKKEATPIDVKYDYVKKISVTSNLQVYKLWERMLNECHTPCYNYYPTQGSTTTVHPEWHTYENFLQDISKVKGYAHWMKEPNKYELDPNYYGANQYGFETSIFVPKALLGYDNLAYSFKGKEYKTIDKIRNEHQGVNLNTKAVGLRLFNNQLPFDHRLKNNLSSESDGLETLKRLTPPQGKIYRSEVWIDQLANVISEIKKNGDSRRLIVSSWNVAELEDMALPPCHAFFQFYVANNKLSCQLYQRSGDMFLGVPFNIASYSLLTCMIAEECELGVGDFIHTIGDAHIYLNHIEQCELQLSRDCRELPKLKLKYKKEDKSIFDVRMDDIVIEGYDPHPHIKGVVSV